MTSAQGKPFPCKNGGLGIVLAVNGQYIFPSPEMAFFERFLAYRYKFAFVIGGSG